MNNLSDIFAGKVPGVKAKMEDEKVGQSVIKNMDVNSKIYGNVLGNKKSFKVFNSEEGSRVSEMMSGPKHMDTNEIMSKKDIDVAGIIGTSTKGRGTFEVSEFLGTKSKAKGTKSNFNVYKFIGTTKVSNKKMDASKKIHNVIYGQGERVRQVLGGQVSKGKFNPIGTIMGPNRFTTIKRDISGKNRSNLFYNKDASNKIRDIIGTRSGVSARAGNVMSDSAHIQRNINQFIGSNRGNNVIYNIVRDRTSLNKDEAVRDVMDMAKPAVVQVYDRPVKKKSLPEIVEAQFKRQNQPKRITQAGTATAINIEEKTPLAQKLGQVWGRITTVKDEAATGIAEGKEEKRPGTVQRAGGTLAKEFKTFFGIEGAEKDIVLTPEEAAMAAQYAEANNVDISKAEQIVLGAKIQKKHPTIDPQLLGTMLSKYMTRKGATAAGAVEMMRAYKKILGAEDDDNTPWLKLTRDIGKGLGNLGSGFPSTEQAALRLMPTTSGVGVMEGSALSGGLITPQKARMLTGGQTGTGFSQMVQTPRFSGSGMAEALGVGHGFAESFDNRFNVNRYGQQRQSFEPVQTMPSMPVQVPVQVPMPVQVNYSEPAVQEMPSYPPVATGRIGPKYSPYSKRVVRYTRGPYKKTLDKFDYSQPGY